MLKKLNRYLARVTVFLIMVALIAGMIGCDGDVSQNLEIRDWYDLDNIRNNLAGSHILMNDLNSTSPGYQQLASPTANGGKGWQPIGTEDDLFVGSLDGQGYEIRDLFINRPDEWDVGLFVGVGLDGIIKDMGLVINITATGFIGGLTALNLGTVSNSYVIGSVTGDDLVGGLVGINAGTVSDSYTTSSVTGYANIGGLVGDNDGTVNNSYSIGSVTGYAVIGGLVGDNLGTVSNSYCTGSVTGNELVGGLMALNRGTVDNSYSTGSVTGNDLVGGLMALNRGTVDNSYYNYDDVLINGESIITIGALFGEDFDEWLANDKFLDVNERLSEEDGYYLINDISDFKQLLAFGQNGTLKFRLTNDLDLIDEPNFYIPYLAGEFDGSGHKISNLSFNFDFVSPVGLFGYLASGGNIAEMGVENINITGAGFTGGLVGYNWEGIVSNSHSIGSVTGSFHVGGLMGENREGTVSNSYFTGSVTGNSSVGGLVGANPRDGIVSNSYSTGSVTGDSIIGGLVGVNDGIVSNSYSISSVTGDLVIGGLVGENFLGTVSGSYSTGNVIGDDSVGGLAGSNSGTVHKSYASGHVTGEICVGGLVGLDDEGDVSNSYSIGNVTGESYVGGLVGWTSLGSVSGCYSTGSVTGSEDVGGLVGTNSGSTVTNSFWDTQTSGQATSDGGTGKNTTEMQDILTFTDTETEGLDEPWDITTVVSPGTRNPSYVWNIVDAVTYPFLSWQP